MVTGADVSRRRIAVNNTLLDGLESVTDLPTFLLNMTGMTLQRIEREIDAVGYLQAVCPVFRVVVMSDRPIFSLVRKYKWPVEHAMAPEYRSKTLTDERHSAYLRERFRIAVDNFIDCTVIDWTPESSLADMIASHVGCDGPSRTILDVAESVDLLQVGSSDWPSVMELLSSSREAVFEGAEGRVRLSVSGCLTASVFVSGRSTVDACHDGPRTPPVGVMNVAAVFDPASSLEFEASVYARLARALGRDLAVVSPWRDSALLRDDTVFWVDLGVRSAGAKFKVLPAYARTYSVLMPSGDLDWDCATTYAAVRRVSRGFSVDRSKHVDYG